MNTIVIISYKPQSWMWQACLKLWVFHSNHHTKEKGACEESHHAIIVKFSIKDDSYTMRCINQCQLPSLFTDSLVWPKRVRQISWTYTQCFGGSGSVDNSGDLIQDQNFSHSGSTFLFCSSWQYQESTGSP